VEQQYIEQSGVGVLVCSSVLIFMLVRIGLVQVNEAVRAKSSMPACNISIVSRAVWC